MSDTSIRPFIHADADVRAGLKTLCSLDAADVPWPASHEDAGHGPAFYYGPVPLDTVTWLTGLIALAAPAASA